MKSATKRISFYERLEQRANDHEHWQKIVLIVALFLLLVVVTVCNLVFGAADISVKDGIRLLLHDDGSMQRQIIFNVRLPRILIASLVGISLSLSGVILQGVMRNSLASPSIIGVTSGASFMGYVFLVMLPQYSEFLTIGTFIGAFSTTLIIYAISFKNGASPMRLVLSGIAISSLLGAGSDLIRTFFPDRLEGVTGFLIGGLNGRTWVDLDLIWPYALVGIIVAVFMPRRMNIMMLGEQVALSLGVNTEKTRLFFIVIASLLAAASVSVVGIIGFVGMIVPHMARLIIGSDNNYLFPTTIILGAIVILACDLIGRTFFNPIEIPVGIIMSALGAPFFLYLLRSKKGIETS
ncbi:iron ABC transporter permease [Acidaminobacter sp. JC074]|uniref:FecCD family ABC transporter permease n=1 Tax=Acidaminobacter sp. JC074 TaxID=2530199 RepID=UPI001F0FB5B1|nr:iron ABC transporter permease [Acidaminobacter sp. JC074]MCH4891052.1 iron ABC transporter permease [Acidaminobacter sp. JC074]